MASQANPSLGTPGPFFYVCYHLGVLGSEFQCSDRGSGERREERNGIPSERRERRMTHPEDENKGAFFNCIIRIVL